MNPSVSISLNDAFDASTDVKGTIPVTVYADEACTTVLTDELAAAGSVYIELGNAFVAHHLSIPATPVGVSLEFFYEDSSQGELAGKVASGDSLDWDADFTKLKLTIAAGLVGQELVLWCYC